jgi:hypothetical protein
MRHHALPFAFDLVHRILYSLIGAFKMALKILLR